VIGPCEHGNIRNIMEHNVWGISLSGEPLLASQE
jgi:hypothetical protein